MFIHFPVWFQCLTPPSLPECFRHDSPWALLLGYFPSLLYTIRSTRARPALSQLCNFFLLFSGLCLTISTKNIMSHHPIKLHYQILDVFLFGCAAYTDHHLNLHIVALVPKPVPYRLGSRISHLARPQSSRAAWSATVALATCPKWTLKPWLVQTASVVSIRYQILKME